jgi:MoxR-like ATPase
MAEGTVTVDGVSHKLPNPFFVVATQNPHESFGVYPLTESQLDRFLIQVELTYPSSPFELGIYRAGVDLDGPLPPGPQLPLQEARHAASRVFAEDTVLQYAQNIAEATRAHASILTGLSVRGALAWISACKAWAWMEGRDYITPADVKRLGPAAIAHRLRLHDEDGTLATNLTLLGEILESVAAPR